MMLKLILDSNIIEYTLGPSGNRKKKAKEILESIKEGQYDGIIPPPVIMELYYRLSKLYGEIFTKNFIKNLLSIPNMYYISLSKDMGHSAGVFYYKYNTISTKKKTPSAVDCLIAGMGMHIPESIICTNDKKIVDIVEINAELFWNIPIS